MTDRVLQNFNIFIDSDNCLSGKGDDFVLQLSSQGINALDGEKIRLSLMSFNMYKNFYNVNANNNEVVLRTDQTPQRTINLTPKNYSTIGKIAEELKIKLLPFLLTDAQSGGSTAIKIIANVLPSTSELLDDGDRIISMTLEFQDIGSNPVPHTLTSVNFNHTKKMGIVVFF
jgi:predicted enzyme involved in methoxymalonyl-ACP biosynthesis